MEVVGLGKSLTTMIERRVIKNGWNSVRRATLPQVLPILDPTTTLIELAEEFGLDAEIERYENPRDQHETHQVEIENDLLIGVMGAQLQTLEASVRETLDSPVENRDRIIAQQDRFVHGVLTE